MKHRTSLIVALGLLLAGADLGACGDKFLVVGRGTRFQRGSEAPRPYAVLIYAPKTSPLAERQQRASVEKALLRAGYRPATVESPAELAEKLKSGPAGVVVANAGDAKAVEWRLGGGPGPVVLLGPSTSANSLLDAVDNAILLVTRAGQGGTPKF